MTTREISDQLQRLVSANDFAASAEKLADDWSSASVGFEAVEPVLRFMEDHPAIEFGVPGALVHFLERFHSKGYEEKLVESITRKPTRQTVWMLNRVINGTSSSVEKQMYVGTLQRAKLNPSADQGTLHQINRFLIRLGTGGN